MGLSWSICGFATDDRKRKEIIKQVSEHDIDVLGIQESWEKEEVETGYKVSEYAWIGRKQE